MDNELKQELESAGIVEQADGTYTYANDFVHETEETLQEYLDRFSLVYGVQGTVLQEEGPQGWPYVQFRGTLNAIRLLSADYDSGKSLPADF